MLQGPAAGGSSTTGGGGSAELTRVQAEKAGLEVSHLAAAPFVSVACVLMPRLHKTRRSAADVASNLCFVSCCMC